jgi:hypothetical protein
MTVELAVTLRPLFKLDCSVADSERQLTYYHVLVEGEGGSLVNAIEQPLSIDDDDDDDDDGGTREP